MKRNYKPEAIKILNAMDLSDSATAFRMLYNIAVQNPHAIVRAAPHAKNSLEVFGSTFERLKRTKPTEYKHEDYQISIGSLDPKNPVTNDIIALKCCKKYWPHEHVMAIKLLRMITGLGLKEAVGLVNKYFIAEYMETGKSDV